MRWALAVLWACSARLRAERSIPKYAHATAQRVMTEGAAEASRQSHVEQSKLQQLVDALNMDLNAAKMRQAELASSVDAARPPPPAPTQRPLLPNFAPESVPAMVRDMAEARLRTAIPAYVYSLVNASAAQATADAAGLGAEVGDGVAMVTAPRAAEAAIAELVRVACKVASGPSEKAARQAAIAATNLTSAGDLAAQATASIADGCADELSQVAAELVLQAANVSRAEAERASAAASNETAARLVAPAAQAAASQEMDGLFTHAQPKMLQYAANLALGAYKAAEASGRKEAEVKIEADELARVMAAAEQMVDAAQNLAGEAGLAALVADVNIANRLKAEVNRSHPDAFRTAVEDIVLP